MGMTILVAVSALYLRQSNPKVQLARLKMVATSHFLGNTAALRPFQQKPIADPMVPGEYIDALYEPDNVKEHIFWPSVLCIATVFSMASTLFIAFQWGYFQEPSMILGGAFLVGAKGLECPDSCPSDVQKMINDYQLGSLLVIEVAFLSAYIWALWQLFQRMVTRDVTVYAFHAITIRVVTAAILSLILFHGLSPAIGDVAALKTPAGTAAGMTMPAVLNVQDAPQASGSEDPTAGSPLSLSGSSFNYFILLAFAIGFFPETALTWLGALARKLIFNMGPSSSYLDIEEIEGIDSYTRARLSELGILDAPRLANCNPMTLALRTPYSLQQIMDWIGQAQLLVLLKKETFNTLRVQGIRTSFQFYELLATAPVPQILKTIDTSYCRLMLDKDPAFVRAKEVAVRMLIQPDYATGEEQPPLAAAQKAA
jgi:hypothetical protein